MDARLYEYDGDLYLVTGDEADEHRRNLGFIGEAGDDVPGALRGEYEGLLDRWRDGQKAAWDLEHEGSRVDWRASR